MATRPPVDPIYLAQIINSNKLKTANYQLSFMTCLRGDGKSFDNQSWNHALFRMGEQIILHMFWLSWGQEMSILIILQIMMAAKVDVNECLYLDVCIS